MGRPGGAHLAPTLAHCRVDLPELLRAPVLRFDAQRRAGAAQRAHAGQVAAGPQVDAGFLAIGVVGGAGTEKRHPDLGGKSPQGGPVAGNALAIGVVGPAGRAAVVDAGSGPQQQAADLQVPHHPAGRAVPMETFARAVGLVAASNVVVQTEQGHAHQNGATMAVHDRFGQAGCATRIDDPQRMVERQPKWRERARGGIVACNGIGEGCVRKPGPGPRQCPAVVEHQQMPHRWQCCTQLCHHRQPLLLASAMHHRVATDQYRGRNLAEAVEHRVAAHVGRADAPDPANADRGQKGDHRLWDVRQVGHHPIAGSHTLFLQVQGQRCNLQAQLRPGDFARRTLAQAALVMADDSRQAGSMCSIGMAQHLLRVVDLCTGEPACARHPPIGQHRVMGCRRLHFVKIPDALPIGIEVVHRPAPQGVITVEGQTALRLQPFLVAPDLRHERRA